MIEQEDRKIPENAAAPEAAPAESGASGSEESAGGVLAEQRRGTNDYFKAMIDRNFLEYAAYVIKDRAIPDVDDGLKPVQRRILWALYKVYDGRTHKVANIVGNTMHYHPHGNASIEEALVVLANKGGCVEQKLRDRKTGVETIEFQSVPYYIARQGNFGNLLTGSPAAAGRYTECSLTQLAHETLFNNDITKFVPTYDGREEEPVVLPAKVPSLLMLGSDGIAVGMATKIMPHNFNELLDAEIAILRGEEFEIYPDFQQGGLMDVREYADGNGRIGLRAKIDIVGRDLVIREIPAVCTTESLVASIERAAEKNKIKISNVQDFTTDRVEIRVTPTRGYDPEKTRNGLYMYTDCAVSISVNMTVICDSRPVQMTVSEVLRRNVDKLLGYLKQELEIALERQNELFHAKTLAQIFFENRIYKRIEEVSTPEQEYAEVHAGLAPFRPQLRRDITDSDIDKLLALPVRRISRFDIEKNQQELAEIEAKIAEINKNLGSLKRYAVKYLESLKSKYGANFPRRTEIEHFEEIDRTAAALNNIKIGWDRKNGYIGTAVKSDDTVVCNEFDRFVCTVKNGTYKVIPLPPDKLFVGRLYDFRRYDSGTVFGIIYREKKSGKYYGKRSSIGGFIMEKEYSFCPPGCQLELLTPRPDAIYTLLETGARGRPAEREINLMELPLRSAKVRGILLTAKPVTKITHSRWLTADELAAFAEPASTIPEEEEPAAGAESAPAVSGKAAGADSAAEPEPSPAAEDGQAAAETESVTAPAIPAAKEEVPEAESVAEPPLKSAAKAGRRRKVSPGRDVPAERPEAEGTPDVMAAPAGMQDSLMEVPPDPVTDKPARKPRQSAARRDAVPETPESGDDDDFGIVQAEFGF